MSPRDLRKALFEYQWVATCTYRTLPEPPQEWGLWRQRRMAVAIRCAGLFLFHGYTWKEIHRKLQGEDGRFMQEDLSRQRIGQYTSKGVDFLMSRGVFVEVKPTPKKRARDASLAPEKPKKNLPTVSV